MSEMFVSTNVMMALGVFAALWGLGLWLAFTFFSQNQDEKIFDAMTQQAFQIFEDWNCEEDSSSDGSWISNGSPSDYSPADDPNSDLGVKAGVSTVRQRGLVA